MRTILPLQTAEDARAAAAPVLRHLEAGGVLAYPTETVYGLGTSLDPAAVARLAAIKERAAERAFLVLDVAPQRLAGLRWTAPAHCLARAFWPGPLSIALAADERFPPSVRSRSGTVAVRDTPLAPLRALLTELAGPLTSTSANLPGEPPATCLDELLRTLGRTGSGDAILVLDGGTLPPSAPSTIVDCSRERPALVREGAVSLGDLRRVLQEEGFALDVA